MWTCTKCGQQLEDGFDSCWRCTTPRRAVASVPAARIAATPRWHLHYRVFRGVWSSWEELFRQASEFADDIGPEKVVSISHSEDRADGVVAVWYWTESRPTD